MHIQRLYEILGRGSRLRSKDIKPFLFFFDFKSAFDSVDYNILFHKLSKVVNQDLVNFTKWYINQVTIRVGKNTIAQNKGVPQGGIASPIFWLVYIDDLLQLLADKYGLKNTYAYADDLLVIVKSYPEAHRLVPRIRLQLQDGPHVTTQESNRLPKLGQTKIQTDHYQPKPKGKNPTLEMLLFF